MSPRPLASLLALLLVACGSSSASTVTDDAGQDAIPDADADAPPSGLTVETTRGPVTGTGAASGVRAFLGIPYAAPPIGDLRFRAPTSPKPWTTPLAATSFGPACPQGVNPLTKVALPTSEDCLTLNVWSKPPAAGGALAPVMVFVHGGSFVFGGAREPLYEGSRLAEQGVVVVTINYRLGALGFLAHPALSKEDAKGASGNYGLLDQQAALRWVRDNAAAFGGDPSRVTLFGESAGATSVCLQMVSPGGAGLFSRAVLESGTCFVVSEKLRDPSAAEDSAEERGARLATAQGCSGDAAATCLRALGTDELLAMNAGTTELQPNFGPNVDGVVLPQAPGTMVLAAQDAKVPLIVGVNGDEGSLFAPAIGTAAEYEAAVRGFDPVHADALLSLYPASSYPTPKDAITRLIGDVAFVCPARYMAQAHSFSTATTFLYSFTHVTPLGASLGAGAFHGSELAFVFGNFVFGAATAEETPLAAQVQRDWLRFAAAGDPNGAPDAAWPRYTYAGDQHLVIDLAPSVGTGLHKAACEALASVYGG